MFGRDPRTPRGLDWTGRRSTTSMGGRGMVLVLVLVVGRGLLGAGWCPAAAAATPSWPGGGRVW